MTTPGEYTPIRLVAGPDTQETDAPLAGQIVLLPPGYPLGSGPANPSRVLGIYGWTQIAAGGELQWLMGSILDTATVDFVRNIPPGGWIDPTQRTVYRQAVRALIQSGWTAADARTLAQNLYLAAKANEDALDAI